MMTFRCVYSYASPITLFEILAYTFKAKISPVTDGIINKVIVLKTLFHIWEHPWSNE